MRIWALLLLFILMTPGCCAAEEGAAIWSRAYGGHGRDELTALAGADGMLLAAGYTTSTDGDLSTRKREGKTGWLLGLGSEGRIVFSCCTAHLGRNEMRSPFAHTDGTFSCVLWGKGKGYEWLRVNGTGKVIARVEVPQTAALCAHTPSPELTAIQPCEAGGEAALLMLFDHGDGTLCAAWMDEEGGIALGGAFAAGAQGCLAAGDAGEAAWIATRDGQLTVTRLSAKGEPRTSGISEERVDAVTGALMGSDGSVSVCGESERGGYLLRVSAENEVLFDLSLSRRPEALCSTETGFAIAGAGGFAAFVDEDGTLLETIDGIADGILALAGAPGGAAVLSKVPQERQPSVTALRQSVFSAEISEQEEEREAQNVAQAQQTPENGRRTQALSTLGGDLLRCEGDGRGVTVHMIDSAGRERFSTRIPITTAADALVLSTALMLDSGDVLLGGHYMTLREENVTAEGVTVLLSADGVLRDIRTVERAGDVLDAQQSSDGRILLRVLGTDGVERTITLAS